MYILNWTCNDLTFGQFPSNLVIVVQNLIQHGIDVNCTKQMMEKMLLLLCCCYYKTNLIDIIQLFIRNGQRSRCKLQEQIWAQCPLFSFEIYYHEDNLLGYYAHFNWTWNRSEQWCYWRKPLAFTSEAIVNVLTTTYRCYQPINMLYLGIST